MDLGLRGARALITGGSRGIGLAVAEALAAEGAAVGILARNATGLATAAERLARHGVPVVTAAADATDAAALGAAVREIAGPLGGLDHLVANVGGTVGGNLADSAPGELTATFALNAGHAAELIRSGLPYLKDSAAGSCVIISSITGMRPAPRTNYAVAKAAEIHLAATAAAERELAGLERGEVLGVLVSEDVPGAAEEHDGSGADRVHPDAVGREFLCGGRGQVDLRGLGGGIGGPRRRPHAGDRGDQHHRAAARGPQVGQARPDQLRGVAGVEREGRGELARGGACEVAAADRAAGAGHQVIEPAERGGDVVDGAAEHLRVGDVGRGRCGPRALALQAPGRGGKALRVTGDEPDGRSLRGQRLGDGEADAAAPPGDQRAAVFQAEIHGSLLSPGLAVVRTSLPGPASCPAEDLDPGFRRVALARRA